MACDSFAEKTFFGRRTTLLVSHSCCGSKSAKHGRQSEANNVFGFEERNGENRGFYTFFELNKHLLVFRPNGLKPRQRLEMVTIRS